MNDKQQRDNANALMDSLKVKYEEKYGTEPDWHAFACGYLASSIVAMIDGNESQKTFHRENIKSLIYRTMEKKEGVQKP